MIGIDPAQVLVLVNPWASGGRVGRWLDNHRGMVERELPGTRIVTTSGAGDAPRIVREALGTGARLVIAVGGDGTASEALGGFFERDRPIAPGAALALVNGGTGGDFARLVGAPRLADWRPRQTLELPRRRIDIGHVAYMAHDGREEERVFLNITSFGAGGEVVARVNRSRKILGGFWTFLGASLRSTLGFRSRPLRLVADGRDPSFEPGPVFVGAVANGQYFGSGMRIAPTARLDDGLFDLVLLAWTSRWRRLVSGLSIYRGAHLDLPGVHQRRVATLEVEPLDLDPVLLDVDGEQPGRLPARFRVLPAALELVWPGDASGCIDTPHVQG